MRLGHPSWWLRLGHPSYYLMKLLHLVGPFIIMINKLFGMCVTLQSKEEHHFLLMLQSLRLGLIYFIQTNRGLFYLNHFMAINIFLLL